MSGPWTVSTWDSSGLPTTTVCGPELDRDAIRAFSTGQCHALALALHETTGWPLVAIGPVGERPDRAVACDGILHLAVVPPGAGEHEVVDILGRRTIDDDEWADYDRQLAVTQADLLAFTPALVAALVRSGWHEPATDAATHHARNVLSALRTPTAAE